MPSLVADKGEAVGYAIDGVDDRAEGVVFSDDGGGGCGGDVRFFFLAADGQRCEYCEECYGDDCFTHNIDFLLINSLFLSEFVEIVIGNCV